ncbi:MAG: peptidoglycan DD-metalloendopeptidase family protein [Saprospiraceae bacterium]
MKKGPFNNKKQLLAYIGAFIGMIATLFLPTNEEVKTVKSSFFVFESPQTVELGDFPVAVPTVKYGFVMEAYKVIESKVEKNQTLGKLLFDAGIDYPSIEKLVENSKGVFNVSSQFRVDKPYMLLFEKEGNKPAHFIFQPNVYEYFVFDLKENFKVEKVEKPIEIRSKEVVGEISSSLWVTLTKQGISYEAAAKMEDALQWSVDFSHTQKGDQFKMIYDQKYIDDEEVGVGQVHAAFYSREGKESYAIWYEDDEHKGFYDMEGRPITSNFLKSPVKYTRISSRFNKARFHPILKRVRPHLGTDYAAPYGTPIYAVGNGVITEAGFTKGNGRYIKIKHDNVYQTQYLHMQKFASGMKRGTQVAQGEVIGYVGSTGLATGPHVCFRFWKNGVQVNHLSENLPAPNPLPESVLPSFFAVRDEMVRKLGELNYESEELEQSPEPTPENAD